MSFFTHEFEGCIVRYGVGKSRILWYTVLFLPAQLAAELPFDRFPRLRIVGEIADVPVAGAWMPTGDGRHYFMVSPAVRKDADLAIGDSVTMRFKIDDQSRVDIPEILAEALEQNAEARARWDQQTPGRQRGLTHRIHTARTDATKQRRLLEVLDELLLQN